MHRRLGIILALAAIAGFAIVGPTNADNAFKNKYSTTTATRDCGNGDHVDYAGPLKLWPPNHKLQTVTVSATDGGEDPPSDQTTILVTPAVADVAGGDGGTKHDPDFTTQPPVPGSPTAHQDVALRSERSGKGEGRTYTLNWTATFDGGLRTCSSSDQGQSPFIVTVPHDMRGGADWK
jgi:hypothetical protein